MTNMPLPPDPEAMNDSRAAWAGQAIDHFAFTTGTDKEDALSDLLADLMHWCDRQQVSFDRELARAREHYEAETLGEQDARAKALPAIAETTGKVSPDLRKPIVIEVRGGVVQNVLNVPTGIEYEVRDYDNQEETN